MLFFVLINEALEVLVHCVKERVDLLQTCLSKRLDLSDTLIDHRCKLLSLIGIFLCCQIEFV